MPDGSAQVLLFAREIPLQWPTPYVFRRPVSLLKGTQLSVIEHYAADASIRATGIPVTFSAYPGAPLRTTEQPRVQQASASPTRRFKLSGTVRSVADDRLVVQHEQIPGFMGAMTMSYGVGKHEELKGVAAGDRIRSDVVVGETTTLMFSR